MLTPKSYEFYEANYGCEMPIEKKESLTQSLEATEFFKTYREARDCYWDDGNEYSEEAKRNGTPYAAVVLAPPDADGGRYAVGDGEFLLLFAGYKPLDKNGKPIRLKDLGYDKLKETW